MPMTSAPRAPADEIVVNLRRPALAAFLAWLIPGAGHLYQGRIGKGLLFFICILGTYSYGMYLGDCKVVYFTWRPPDARSWAYFCQVGVGLAALPALIQARQGPVLGFDFMAPPANADAWRRQAELAAHQAQQAGRADSNLVKYQSPDELAWWHKYLNRYFELGMVYTMIAGLLNVLAIYDAYAGPVPLEVPSDDADDGDGEE